jgi:hypothetical protein
MAFVPRKRMGPPPWNFAADAHDCIMVWVLGPTEYNVVARLMRAPERGLLSPKSLMDQSGLFGIARSDRGDPAGLDALRHICCQVDGDFLKSGDLVDGSCAAMTRLCMSSR